MIATAKLRYLGVSAQKTRLVVDTVRGKNVGDVAAFSDEPCALKVRVRANSPSR